MADVSAYPSRLTVATLFDCLKLANVKAKASMRKDELVKVFIENQNACMQVIRNTGAALSGMLILGTFIGIFAH